MLRFILIWNFSLDSIKVWIRYAYVQVIFRSSPSSQVLVSAAVGPTSMPHEEEIKLFDNEVMKIILIWGILYSYRIFYTSMEYSKWVWKKQNKVRKIILIWDILYAYRIFYTSIKYYKWVWKKQNEVRKIILIWDILYSYKIFQMSMKNAKQCKEIHTHLGYSILI